MEDMIKLWCIMMCTAALILIAVALGGIVDRMDKHHKCTIKLEQMEK